MPALSGPASPAKPAKEDKSAVVVAEINGRKITLAELEERLAEAPPAVRIRIRKNKEQYLENLVQSELLYQEAVRRRLEAAPEVEKRIGLAKRRILVEEFVRRLMEQQIDPMKVNINWEEFREKQREAASETVRGALVLDEVARRETITASDAEVAAEVERYAERSGRSAAAVRARLEKEGGLARLYSGLRREKAMDFLLSKATKIQG